MIKNIIFDLSEVIISGYHGIDKIIEKNTYIKADEFLKVKQDTKNLFLETMRGKFSEEEYLKSMIEVGNFDISIKELKEYIRQNLNISVKGTMEIIKRLKGRYNLILLSDHVKEWVDFILDNNKELDVFDKKYFSYEFGKIKSDNETFRFILNELNINTDETIFIDDSQTNIDMAKSYGIDGILFINAEELENQLLKLKILQ